jgi:hypothetical protein
VSWKWRKDREAVGLIGYTRAAEVTYGSNGWHPHTHALLIMRAGVTDSELERVCGDLIDRWSARAVWRGLAAPLPGVQDWRRVSSSDVATVTEYLSKTHKDVDPATIGLELTYTQSKTARTIYSTRSMWDVLEGAVTLGTAADVRVWQEWERTSKGRRALVWSRGLRERFALAPEQSDDEIAAEELGSDEDTLVTITAEGWDLLARYRPHLIPQILSVTESGGWAALAAFLSENGIPWEATR